MSQQARRLSNSPSWLSNPYWMAFSALFAATLLLLYIISHQNSLNIQAQPMEADAMPNLAHPSIRHSDRHLSFKTAHEIFASHSDLAMSDYCGHWQDDYIQLHHRIRNVYNSSNPNRRFIVYQCLPQTHKCKGLGDELLGITSTLLLALLTDRAIIIQHENFTSAFDPVAVDWRFSDDIELPAYRFMQSKHLSILRSKRTLQKDVLFVNLIDIVFKSPENSEEVFENLLNATARSKILVLKFNRGYTVTPVLSEQWWGKKLRAMGLNADNVFGCLLRFLLRPKAEVKEAVKELATQLQSPSTFSVCIHHRSIFNGASSDNVFTVDKLNGLMMRKYNFLFLCASKLSSHFAKKNQTTKWFFMSSSYLFKLKVKKKFYKQILIADIKPKHVDFAPEGDDYVSALQSTAMEWYLYSLCDKFVFVSSGMSKTAAMYSLKPNSSYMFPHEAFRGRRRFEDLVDLHCQPEVPTLTSFMALEWSLL